MTWASKVSLFSAAFVFSVYASAQHFSFNAATNGLETRLLNNRSQNNLSSMVFHLSVGQMDVQKQTDGFDSITATGFTRSGHAGQPELYTTGSLIAVPAGYEAKLSVIAETDQVIPNVMVKPAQHKFRCGPSSHESFSFDANLYASNVKFPAQNVQLESVGSIQGLTIERVGVYPVQMDMATHAIKVTTDLTVRVDFTKVTHVAPNHLSKSMFELARAVTANGADLSPDVVRTDATESMLIVVADSLLSTMDPLVQWKRSRGLTVDIVSYTTAGGSKEKVKAYVQNYYDTKPIKPSYLLFVGNKSTLPPFMESTSSGDAATDYDYAQLAGSSNVPNVAYGRLAADNVADVQAQITRWIDYEKTPEQSATWYPKGMTIASDESGDGGPSDKEYAQQIETALKAGTYSAIDEFYQGEQTATSSNITQALKEGRTWIGYIGHGSGTSWASTNDDFSVDTIDTLDNDGRLPIIIDVACDNGSWVELSRCFGKAWVTRQHNNVNAGAVGYYGGSVSISWDPPAVMSVGIAKYHFQKAIHSLGASVLAGQMYLIEQSGSNADTLENFKWYNLLGDPSLTVRTNTPLAYTVKNVTQVTNHDVSVTVTAVDSTGKAVKGVIASLHTGTATPLAVGATDDTGTVQLQVQGVGQLESDTMLTTTGYNLETYERTLQ